MLDVRFDRAVGDLSGEVRLPVVLQSRREQRIEHAVEHGVGHRRDHFRDDGRHLADWGERLLSAVGPPGPAADENAERLAVIRFGDERQRRRNLERREHAQLLRRRFDEISVELEHILGALHRKKEKTRDDVLDGMQLVLERRHHSEVAPAAAQRPEQILVFLFAGDKESAVSRHDIGREQVVACQTECPGEKPDPAAERQSGDAGGRDNPARRRQPKRVRRVIESAPGAAAFGADRSRLRIDTNTVHLREIDHDAVVVRAEARHAMRAAANGKVQALLARELDGGHDVGDIRASHDHTGPPINHPVVDLAGRLVCVVPRRNRLTMNVRA